MSMTQTLKNRGFMVKEHGPYVLVHPSKGKRDWEADELRFRSVVLDAGGRVVSSGWPKFFNQGEWPDHDARIANELASGQAVITHKHDGSLIIRSVLGDGRVLLRTRDSFDGGKFAPLAHAVAQAKYPWLLDPDVFTHGSLLFEYVGTGNQIVVRYHGDDDLVLIGAAEHDTNGGVRYLCHDALADVAHVFGLRLVETYAWAESGIAGVLDQVRNWDTAEGVVVRSRDGQTLLKIKSAWYFAQHALRWATTYESICRFAIDGAIADEAQLVAKLVEVGWDYEITQVAREHFARYREACIRADTIKQAAIAFVAAFDSQTSGRFADDERARRKAFAARVFGPGADPDTRGMSAYWFYAYDGKIGHLEAKLLQQLVLGAG